MESIYLLITVILLLIMIMILIMVMMKKSKNNSESYESKSYDQYKQLIPKIIHQTGPYPILEHSNETFVN